MNRLIAHLKRDQRHLYLAVGLLLLYVLVLVILVFLDYKTGWDWPGFEGKRIWDYHNAWLPPVATFLVGYMSFVREGHQRDNALQAYFDGMRQILDNKAHDLAGDVPPPRDAGASYPEDAPARWLTLSTLLALGPDRKRLVLQFLHETNLIHQKQPGQVSVSLVDADLRSANLAELDLTEANLASANLARADLTGTKLTKANLTKADLTKVDLTKADLTKADLTGAKLTGASVTQDQLSNCKALKGASMPDGSVHV